MPKLYFLIDKERLKDRAKQGSVHKLFDEQKYKAPNAVYTGTILSKGKTYGVIKTVYGEEITCWIDVKRFKQAAEATFCVVSDKHPIMIYFEGEPVALICPAKQC